MLVVISIFQMYLKESEGGQGYVKESGGRIAMPCYPLYSLLLALNVSKVDFWSLDVEGAEYPILESFPFNKVDISVLAVEDEHGKHTRPEMKAMMKKHRYKTHKEIKLNDKINLLYVNDIIFVKDTK